MSQPALAAAPEKGTAGLVVLAFLTSGTVLVAELVAPRLLARHLGTSLFTWGATIATFLGGLALGHAWGGRLADRRGARPLPLVLLGAAATLAASLALDLGLSGALAAAFGVRVRALVLVPVCFVLPACFLGALPPLLIRAALRRSRGAGRVFGRLSAAGSFGAVAGVLLTGYALIPTLSTDAILLATAGLLGVLGLAALPLARAHAEVALLPAERSAPPGGVPPPARASEASPGPLSPRALLALAFLAGAVLLAVEMLAARITVVALGSSIYTWTAVLAVVLAGSAIGAWLGGRRADANPGRRAVGELLAWSVLGVGICLWTPHVMGRVVPESAPLPVVILLAVTAGFLPASVALGALWPALARAALRDPATDGRVVGRMQAFGTLGAVAGALLTNFVLVPLVGVPGVVIALTIALTYAADLVTRTRALRMVRVTLTVLAVLALLPGEGLSGLGRTVRGFGKKLGLRADAEGVFVEESGYYRILVEPEPKRWCLLAAAPDVDGLRRQPALADRLSYDDRRRRLFWDGAPMTDQELAQILVHLRDPADVDAVKALQQRTRHTVRQMALDKLTHGFVDLQDPTWVGYDYELLAAAVWRTAPRAGTGQHAFFVGGGPYTFQRRLLAMDPEARLVTAEIDPAVTRAAMSFLGLAANDRHRIVHEDARIALPTVGAAEGERFDVVFGDAFNDFSVPWHLTTEEFARAVKSRLAPRGLYLVNVVDMWSSGRFLAAFHATLGHVFEHVAVLTLGPRSDATRETFLLVASDAPLALGDLRDDFGRRLDVVRYGPADLGELASRTRARILTDAFAPVEALLAPVARAAGE